MCVNVRCSWMHHLCALHCELVSFDATFVARSHLQKSGATIPYTLMRSHSSRAMVMVNQPVLSQELEIFLQRRRTTAVWLWWTVKDNQKISPRSDGDFLLLWFLLMLSWFSRLMDDSEFSPRLHLNTAPSAAYPLIQLNNQTLNHWKAFVCRKTADSQERWNVVEEVNQVLRLCKVNDVQLCFLTSLSVWSVSIPSVLHPSSRSVWAEDQSSRAKGRSVHGLIRRSGGKGHHADPRLGTFLTIDI